MTADVLPLETEAARTVPEPPQQSTEPEAAQGRRQHPIKPELRPAPPQPKQAARPKALDPSRPVDIDRRSWERLKRGQITIESRLDLHGRTQGEAHAALDRFLSAAAARGERCVLVVTGKGDPERGGVLRQMVPRWLGEKANRDTVLTYSPAQPRHGGNGALYILIKRRRDHRGR
ncbi:MAG: Smr/MutS family protein [Geminicoccaceae bacterium]